MANCSECDNEMLMCVCPKELGGGGEEDEDKAYEDKIDQVAAAITDQCAILQAHAPKNVDAFIASISSTLNSQRATPLIEQLNGGTFTAANVLIFKETFKNLRPNKAMLEALSDSLNLDVFPNPANTFSSGMKQAIDALEGWPPYPVNIGCTFQKALETYNAYAQNSALTPTEKLILPVIFWAQIKAIGSPIIEKLNDDMVTVHFLFPTSGYDSDKKELYVAGDFHGFTSTRTSKQKMAPLSNTGIMHRSDNVPKDAVVTYNFIQMDKRFNDKKRPFFSGPSEALPESFYPSNQQAESTVAFNAPTALDGTDPFNKAGRSDPNAKHPSVACCPPGMSMFFANVDNDLPELGLASVEWPTLLSAESGKAHLQHKDSYLCDEENKLKPDVGIDQDYASRLQDNAVYTRAINVFEPKSGEVEHLLVVNDGLGYLSTNLIDKLDKLMEDDAIPNNTAVIFVTTLSGLRTKLMKEEPGKFKANMDVRAAEFGEKIDDYASFLTDTLLPTLGYDNVPVENRTVIGSSMSGTASIYMGMPHTNADGDTVPAQFGKVIAQAPSYSNRHILDPIIKQRQQEKKENRALDLSERIQLSCGTFDSLTYAQNLNLDHTKELAQTLGMGKTPLTVLEGNYGHLIHCWSQEISTTLPSFYEPTLRHEDQDTQEQLIDARL